MRLLVSPRDVEEAKRSGAADIIDVKRPAEGSLGANFPWIIRAVKDLSDKPVKDEFPEKFVVIAAYSDYERLGTISPFVMSPLAAAAGADVAMVDTGRKDGKSTFEFMNEEELAEFAGMNAAAGMQTALAGSLCFEHIPALKRINPDIIGVRGMVCGGNRNSTIQEDLVIRLARMVG